ncbi:MAG: Trk system potassium transporter TrkA [Anaerolineae bacterium]
MNIVILGAGSLGTYLAKTLAEEQHDVFVIDKDAKALEKLLSLADVAIRVGSGSDWQLLEELLAFSPHLFIAFSSDDETNLVACSLAKNLGYPKTVARLSSAGFLNCSRLDFGRLFFVDHFLAVELAIAHDIFKSVMSPGGMPVETLAHGAVQMRTVIVPSSWLHGGKRLAEIGLPRNLLVGLIRKKGQEELLFPKGQDRIEVGDELTIIGETKAMLTLLEIFGIVQRKIKSVVVAGASKVSLSLCRILEEYGISVKLIEQDEEKCREMAKLLKNTAVLNQEVSNWHALSSERVHLADAFIACSESCETNLLVSILAKELGCPEVIALVSDHSFAPFLKKWGIFYCVSEKISVLKKIHSFLSFGPVASLSSLYDKRVQILEIKILSDSKVVGIPIVDLRKRFPEEFVIAFIESRGRINIVRGDAILSPGDTVIILCSSKHAQSLEKLF